MLQSVSFTHKNKVPGILTSAGSVAVAGLSFGPPGIWVGAILGVVAGSQADVSVPSWAESRGVCQSDLEKLRITFSQKTKDSPAKPNKVLWLPVALDYPLQDADPPQCWHTLPVAKGPGVPIGANAGWFYRIVPEDAAPEATDPPVRSSPVPPVLRILNVDDKVSLPRPFMTKNNYFSGVGSGDLTFPGFCLSCRGTRVGLMGGFGKQCITRRPRCSRWKAAHYRSRSEDSSGHERCGRRYYDNFTAVRGLRDDRAAEYHDIRRHQRCHQAGAGITNGATASGGQEKVTSKTNANPPSGNTL